MIAPHALARLAEAPGALDVYDCPRGMDARLAAAVAAQRGGLVVFVAPDAGALVAFEAALQFFAPDLPRAQFPAWDCMPYDRVSPSPEVASRRCAALAWLDALAPTTPAVLIIAAGALMQRTLPRIMLASGALGVRAGQELSPERFRTFLETNGYAKTGAVREPGDYAFRGGLIDLFPPGAANPVRLDLFGDQVEEIRDFDPETQRSIGQRAFLDLAPVSEALITPQTQQNFRRRFLEAFGGEAGQDPMLDGVKAGVRRQGVEHLLHCFYDELATLADYLPPQAVFLLDPLARAAMADRWAQAQDSFRTRKEANPGARIGAVDRLYLDAAAIDALLSRFALRALHAEPPPSGQPGLSLQARRGRDFGPERAAGGAVFDHLAGHVETLAARDRRVVVAAWTEGSRERLGHVLADHGMENFAPIPDWPSFAASGARRGVAILPLEQGFEAADLAVISEQDILGDRLARPRKRRNSARMIAEAAALSVGDLVVHIDHGIARYDGLKTLDVQGAPHDCLELGYSGGDKLFLPVENVELISRFGGEGEDSQLDRLGGTAWQTRKARARRKLRDLAVELIKIAAERALKTAPSIDGGEGAFEEFCAAFPYDETDDQLGAIADVLEDLGAGRPMDRLICGDVGFGKTEVALRAAFIVAMTGRQVAVVAPTTLLSRQHYKTFSARFHGWPMKVRQLSRLVAAKDASLTREGLKSGDIDVVIGTHALLAKTIGFRDLGLLIIDEEQHFGVKHKERLKELRADVHVLTLSATPIPRTLQGALSGIRDLSLIATPPVDRLAVRTYVSAFDPVTIREALLRERFRGGQSFFVVPRIADLDDMEVFLKTQVPEVKVVKAHGQMPATELEDIMTAFYEGEYDVLLSTTIVESGLDIPRANTLIVHRADLFGLAQLYQLRGRVGRSKLRAYAYLTTPDKQLSPGAEKRLNVLQSLDSLGAGFMLASHDLDMRGGGNLLGEEQSGHIREVGVELYQQMLADAVEALKTGDAGAVAAEEWSPAISVGVAVLIPESYVDDLGVRLALYRRLSGLQSDAEREAFAAELIDRFGPLPEEAAHLIAIAALKGLCKRANVAKLDSGPKGVSLSFRKEGFPDVAALVGLVQRRAGDLRLRPDGKLVQIGEAPRPADRLRLARGLLETLCGLLRS